MSSFEEVNSLGKAFLEEGASTVHQIEIAKSLRNACVAGESAISAMISAGIVNRAITICRELNAQRQIENSDSDSDKKKLVSIICQFVANFSAQYEIAKAYLMGRTHSPDLSHLLASCVMFGSRKTQGICVNIIYNCVSNSNTEANWERCSYLCHSRDLLCQLLLMTMAGNVAQRKIGSLSATANSSAEVEVVEDDSVLEWMHILVFHICKHNCIYSLFDTIKSSSLPKDFYEQLRSRNEESLECAYPELPIVHEQLIALQLLLCVLEDPYCIDELKKSIVHSASLSDTNLHMSVMGTGGLLELVFTLCRVLDAMPVKELLAKEGSTGLQSAEGGEGRSTLDGLDGYVQRYLRLDFIALALQVIAAACAILPEFDSGCSRGACDTASQPTTWSQTIRIQDRGMPPSCLGVRVALARSTGVVRLCGELLRDRDPAAQAREKEREREREREKERERAKEPGKESGKEGKGCTAGRPGHSIVNQPGGCDSSGTGEEGVIRAGQTAAEPEHKERVNVCVRSCLQLLGNLAYRCTFVQDELRESGCLATVLCHCATNFENPLAREWALLCVRNACEDEDANVGAQQQAGQHEVNKTATGGGMATDTAVSLSSVAKVCGGTTGGHRNRAYIEGLRAQEVVVQSADMRRLGLTAKLNAQTGKVSFTQDSSSNTSSWISTTT